MFDCCTLRGIILAFLREKWRAAVSYPSLIQLRILPQNHMSYTRTVVSLAFVPSTGNHWRVVRQEAGVCSALAFRLQVLS